MAFVLLLSRSICLTNGVGSMRVYLMLPEDSLRGVASSRFLRLCSKACSAVMFNFLRMMPHTNCEMNGVSMHIPNSGPAIQHSMQSLQHTAAIDNCKLEKARDVTSHNDLKAV